MKSSLLRGAAALLLLSSAASAQTYIDAYGTVIPGVATVPFPFTPLAPGQHNLAPTSATALTPPSGARYATVCASGALARYTTDGVTAPTANVGMPLAAGACMTLSGALVIGGFRAFSSAGVLDVEYFK